jgi:hypothetical protein
MHCHQTAGRPDALIVIWAAATGDATAGATGDGCATGMYECLIRMNGRVEKLPLMLLH